ncbi:hypothetical protein GM547_13120, partial [Streptococcus pneumoniae]|nr:hypothetical protein [Streptococcus pneumoniae]
KLNEHESYRNTSFDLLVGGTPCQSFSNAGLNKGMDDERGPHPFFVIIFSRRANILMIKRSLNLLKEHHVSE